MQVRTAIDLRLSSAQPGEVSTLRVRLPTRLKADKISVRIALFLSLIHI